MKVYIKNISRKKGEFQFYMHQFVEACIRQNIPFVNELHVCAVETECCDDQTGTLDKFFLLSV